MSGDSNAPKQNQSKEDSTLDKILDLLVTNLAHNYRDMELGDDLTYKDFAEYRDEQVAYAHTQIKNYCQEQVRLARIDELERIHCCDYEPETKKQTINICNGDHLDRIKELKDSMEEIVRFMRPKSDKI